MTRTTQSKRKGSQNFQSSSRAIEKRLIQRHMQRIPVALTYDHTPAYSNFHHGTIQGESIACADHFPGYIFMCNGKTKADCYKYRVFGLPSGRMDILQKIKPHMRLFLYDFDMKLLYGVYVAASDGRLAIEPAAFGGQFSAQVRFEILRDCIPLPESIFKPAIADNYKGGSKFRQELSNKQVANLISLFRPVAEPSPGIAGSLIPNTVQTATITPRSSEIRAQTASELSHEYNQYLARLNHADEGAASAIRHVEPGLSLAHAPHTLLANRDLPPDLGSASSQFGPYNSADAYQAYFDGNPVVHHRSTGMPYDTERLMLQQLEPRNNCYKQGKTAAYWVQMASEDAKGVHSSSPASIGIGSESIGASDAVAGQACSAVQDINDRGTVQQKITVHDNNHNVHALANDAPTEPVTQSHFEAPSHGPAHLHSSSSGAVYSGAQAREDPAPIYAGPDRGLPFAGPGFGANSMSLYLSETAPVHALQTSHAENILQVSQAHNYNPGMSVASANMPVQAHGQLLHQVPIQAHAQLLHQVPVQAHGQVLHQVQVQPQVPAQSNSSAHLYYEDPGQVHQYYAQMPSSDNTAVYWTGVAHDPNQVYQYPHMLSSGNSSTYWAGMVYQDPSQAYQDPHMLTYGQTGSYSHNVAVNNPSLQAQVHNPLYVAAASHMPSST